MAHMIRISPKVIGQRTAANCLKVTPPINGTKNCRRIATKASSKDTDDRINHCLTNSFRWGLICKVLSSPGELGYTDNCFNRLADNIRLGKQPSFFFPNVQEASSVSLWPAASHLLAPYLDFRLDVFPDKQGNRAFAEAPGDALYPVQLVTICYRFGIQQVPTAGFPSETQPGALLEAHIQPLVTSGNYSPSCMPAYSNLINIARVQFRLPEPPGSGAFPDFTYGGEDQGVAGVELHPFQLVNGELIGPAGLIGKFGQPVGQTAAEQ